MTSDFQLAGLVQAITNFFAYPAAPDSDEVFFNAVDDTASDS
jgi:hypothetical protein